LDVSRIHVNNRTYLQEAVVVVIRRILLAAALSDRNDIVGVEVNHCVVVRIAAADYNMPYAPLAVLMAMSWGD
jgi:hypothetical protein